MLPLRQPPPPPAPLTLAKLLLVEGDTPMHFFEALLRQLGLDTAIEIRNFRGVGDFKTFLINLVDTDEFRQRVTSVGVIRDAEQNQAAQARSSVDAALVAASLTASRVPLVQTSVFILPDNVREGMIETLCLEAVQNEPSLAAAWRCVEDFFSCLQAGNVPLPAAPLIDKNRAQAYLATRQEAQLFPGVAAYRGYWPFDNPVFDSLKQFLHDL